MAEGVSFSQPLRHISQRRYTLITLLTLLGCSVNLERRYQLHHQWLPLLVDAQTLSDRILTAMFSLGTTQYKEQIE